MSLLLRKQCVSLPSVFFKIFCLRHLSWTLRFLGWVSFHLSCMEFSELLFSQIWRGVYILSFSPCPIPSLFFLLWDPSYMSVRPPDSVLHITLALCIFFTIFLCSADWIFSIGLSSRLPILYSAVLNLQLSPSSDF